MLGEVAKDVIGNNETKITSFLEILEERVIFNRDHSFSTYAKISEKLTFLNLWYEHVCIFRVYENFAYVLREWFLTVNGIRVSWNLAYITIYMMLGFADCHTGNIKLRKFYSRDDSFSIVVRNGKIFPIFMTMVLGSIDVSGYSIAKFKLQSVRKTTETHYIFMKKSWKMLDLLKDTQNSPSALVQFRTKSEKAMPGSGGQE